jgi:hypothetical protein
LRRTDAGAETPFWCTPAECRGVECYNYNRNPCSYGMCLYVVSAHGFHGFRCRWLLVAHCVCWLRGYVSRISDTLLSNVTLSLAADPPIHPCGQRRPTPGPTALGCRTGTDTGTGEPVPGPADPVVGKMPGPADPVVGKMPGAAPLGSQGENKTQKTFFLILSIYKFMYICGSRIGPLAQLMLACHLGTMDHPVATSARRQSPPQAALAAVERWPNSQAAADPGLPVGQSVCDTKKKVVTGRYRPVPSTGTGAGRSDPVDPVTRWGNLATA